MTGSPGKPARRRAAAQGLALPLALLLGGCWVPRPEADHRIALRDLQSDDPVTREAAFQSLTEAGDGVVGTVKPAIDLGAGQGFPLVAVLYIHGEGRSVPLELRARHLAGFDWPRGREAKNAIVEPYVWNQIERDLVRTGRPALRPLADALARDASGEAKAMRVVRVMLRIGGRAAAGEFARLLDTDRPLDGVRICDVAAGALLYLGRREAALRMVEREALVAAAREWWERAKDQPEAEWLRSAAEALAERWEPGDRKGIRPVLELLAGQTLEDPKAWWENNRGWSPPWGAVHPEELLPLLSAERPRAYEANRRLEEATGARLDLPRVERLSELCAALRLWRPAPDLALRWRRYLASATLRFSVAIVGYHPDRRSNHVLAAFEKHFHATEDETARSGAIGSGGEFVLHVQSRELGTRLMYSEHFASEEVSRGYVAELPAVRPVVTFSSDLKTCAVVRVEETTGRRPSRPPEVLFAEVRARLRALAGEAEGRERRLALLALGYCQDRGDLEFLRAQQAGEALLLLGDPEALQYAPRLEPHEIEMALRKAEDPRVREYLEKLRAEVPAPRSGS